jgi:hypothetical protein
VIESLGLPFDADKARMVDHISLMLRQRGITSEAQVSAFISALPTAMAAHAAQAGAARSASGKVHIGVQGVNNTVSSLSEVLSSLDESAIVQATEAAVAVALQVPAESVTSPGAKSVTTSAQRSVRASAPGTGVISDDAVATVLALFEKQPGMSLLSPGRLQSLAAALVAQLHTAASNGTLDRATVQQMLEQAQQVAAAALAAQQQQQQQQAMAMTNVSLGGAAAAVTGGTAEALDPAAELSPVQSAAVTLLTSVGAKVTVRRLSAGAGSAASPAAAAAAKQQQLEVAVELPAGVNRSEIEQLLPKLQLPNLRILPAPAAPAAAAAAAAVKVKQEHPAAPAAGAAATPTAAAVGAQQAAARTSGGSDKGGTPPPAENNTVHSVINALQLHSDLVGMLMQAEPGSLRHKSIHQTLELLEGSEAFLLEVKRHEAAAATAAGAVVDKTGSSSGEGGSVKQVQFVTCARPAGLDTPLSRGGSDSSAKTQQQGLSPSAGEGSGLTSGGQGLGTVPGHTTRAGLAALNMQLNMHLAQLKEVRAQIEQQAKQGGINLLDPAAAAAAAAGVGGMSGCAAAVPAAAAATSLPAAAHSSVPVVAGTLLGTAGGVLPGFRGVADTGSIGVASMHAAADTAGLPAAAAAAALPGMPVVVPGRLSSGGGSGGAGLPAAAAAGKEPAAAAAVAGSRIAGISSSGVATGIALPGGSPTSLAAVLQQHSSSAAAAAAAPPASLPPIRTGQRSSPKHQQQQMAAAAAADGSSSTPLGAPTAAMRKQQAAAAVAAAAGADSRVSWQATVVAPASGTLQPKGSAPEGSAALKPEGLGDGGGGLVQLFAVAGELPADVAALLPEVLVVTAKQLRSEIMVDVAQVSMHLIHAQYFQQMLLFCFGSNPGPTARGWAKKATGIDGLVRVISIAQSTRKKLGTITTTTLMSRTRLAG